MKVHKLAIAAAILPGLFTVAAQAAEFRLSYSAIEWVPFGDALKATMRVEVRNVGPSALANVDVTIAHPGIDAMDRAPLQLGALPAGEARNAVTGFVFSARNDAPLVWRIQFDEDGARREAIVVGQAEGEPQ